jgi:Dna[CI] antecedent, DciA
VTKEDQTARRKKTSFVDIGKVLDKIVGQLGLDMRLREVALFELWPTLVSPKLAEKSRPLFVDNERNLVVAVKDAVVAQELGFIRTELTEKLRLAGNGLGVKVKGLRFDLRHNFDK